MLEAMLGTAAQMGPSLLGYHGQQQTNRANVNMQREAFRANQASAREAMQFENQQAQAQMKFQEKMSSSAMQRMKEDYKKAGVNPLLGISNPASTPAGSSGSGSSATAQAPDLKNPFEAFAGSTRDIPSLILQAQKQKEEIGLIRAQKNNVNVDSAVKTKGIPEAEIKNEGYKYFRDLFKKLQDGSIGDHFGEMSSEKALKNAEKYKNEDYYQYKRNFMRKN